MGGGRAMRQACGELHGLRPFLVQDRALRYVRQHPAALFVISVLGRLYINARPEPNAAFSVVVFRILIVHG
jgi:hypothetical protein